MVKNVATIKGDTTAESAIIFLYEKHIGSVIIVDDKGKCEGIFTTRDALRLIAQKSSLEIPIRNVMTKNLITIRDNGSFSEALSLISNHGIRHLPVVDLNDRLVGILSIRGFLEEVVGIIN
jgi:CBS domain-containing protein